MILENRFVLVTGGSRGIGYEICKLFLENGAQVLAVSRDPRKLEGAKRSLPKLEIFKGDMSVSADIERVVGWVADRWDRIDILINNAGILPSGSEDLAGQPDDLFELTLKVNVMGPHLCTKHLLPLLLKSSDPRVVNLGSLEGVLTPRLSGAYAISKAALHALTIAWSNALAGKVAVNAMSPGWVRTDMAPNAPGDPRDSAETALWLVTQPRELTGEFARDKSVIGWMPMDAVERLNALNPRVRQNRDL